MAPRCSVFGCPCRGPNGVITKRYYFPKDKTLRAKWIYLCGINYKVSDKHRVCERHFSQKQRLIHQDEAPYRGRRVLKPEAVPDVNLPGKSFIFYSTSSFPQLQWRKSFLFLWCLFFYQSMDLPSVLVVLYCCHAQTFCNSELCRASWVYYISNSLSVRSKHMTDITKHLLKKFESIEQAHNKYIHSEVIQMQV